MLDIIVKNGDDEIMQYSGGKGAYGTYQKLINLMPPHDTYIETHLGSGALMRYKKPAKFNIGIDINPNVIMMHDSKNKYELKQMDAVEFLNSYQFDGTELIYCDPPYLINTRKSGRKIYDYEYNAQQHSELLDVIRCLNCKVMISGYRSKLYEDALKNWNMTTFTVRTRSGSTATECIWMNYQKPNELHDYSYVGDNFRDRERLKRKTTRWLSKINEMPLYERQSIVKAIYEANYNLI